MPAAAGRRGGLARGQAGAGLAAWGSVEDRDRPSGSMQSPFQCAQARRGYAAPDNMADHPNRATSACATRGVTNFEISPPSRAISLTSFDAIA